jgi:hypothetical protein
MLAWVGNMKVRTRHLSTALLLASVAAALGVAISSAGSDQPTYYVDGARPSRTEGVLYTEHEGCVPYSASRPELYVCGPLPDGFVPPSEPFQDSEICSLAVSELEERRTRMAATGMSQEEIESLAPAVDVSSCQVTRLSEPSNGPEYMVAFKEIGGTGSSWIQVPV